MNSLCSHKNALTTLKLCIPHFIAIHSRIKFGAVKEIFSLKNETLHFKYINNKTFCLFIFNIIVITTIVCIFYPLLNKGIS